MPFMEETAAMPARCLHVPAAGRRGSGVIARLVAGVVFVGLAAEATGCAGPIWYLDPGFGERLATEKKRPLLLYFKTWDSTQHRNMKAQVFETPAVRAEMVGTVNVELEWAWSASYNQKYRVPASQVCVICAPDGHEVGRVFTNPVPEPGKFLEWLRDAKAKAVPPPASGPTSPTSAKAQK